MSETFIQLAFGTSIIAFTVNIAIAMYGIFTRPSLSKKFICLLMFTDSINLFALFIGFRLIRGAYPKPPILSNEPISLDELEDFKSIAVDPLPQALVLTAIVISLAVSMLLLGLILMYYEHYGTTSIQAMRSGCVEEVSE
jgi:Multisubunit Na+/H+ antiporter, MnhC subunit